MRIAGDRSRLAGVPAYDPEIAEQPDYYEQVYGWWGYPAFWAPGHVYPLFPY